MAKNIIRHKGLIDSCINLSIKYELNQCREEIMVGQ